MSVKTFKKGWLGGLTDIWMTSPMGMRWGRPHQGIDLGVVVGTYIEAPYNGVVTFKGFQKGYGLSVGIYCELGDGVSYTIFFAHLHKVKDNIVVGKQLTAGTVFAYTGGDKNDKPNCGSSTGAHLHLEVRIGKTLNRINPVDFVNANLYKKVNGKKEYVHEGINEYINEDDAEFNNDIVDLDVTDETDTSYTEDVPIEREVVESSSERLAPGIWQIVKLVMDSSVLDRQVIDSSISMMTGSLHNWFNKVCQEPFVEFSGDTYGDQYFLFVRKPPFDLEGVHRGIKHSKITISDDEIISINLNWNTQNIYSWYQLIPYAETMGMENILMYMPAIFFPEYASIWGSRNLTVRSQYVSLFSRQYGNADDEKKKQENGENIMRNCIADLKYMIDCNAYAPFVRSGTITLNGDRRIKRGMFVLMPNNELFYVDAVSNSISISETSYQRTTTLTVSHGMFMDFIDGYDYKGNNVGYFNLIDYGENFDVKNLKEGNYLDMISKWKVNFNSFIFFLNKFQLFYSDKSSEEKYQIIGKKVE